MKLIKIAKLRAVRALYILSRKLTRLANCWRLRVISGPWCSIGASTLDRLIQNRATVGVQMWPKTTKVRMRRKTMLVGNSYRIHREHRRMNHLRLGAFLIWKTWESRRLPKRRKSSAPSTTIRLESNSMSTLIRLDMTDKSYSKALELIRGPRVRPGSTQVHLVSTLRLNSWCRPVWLARIFPLVSNRQAVQTRGNFRRFRRGISMPPMARQVRPIAAFSWHRLIMVTLKLPSNCKRQILRLRSHLSEDLCHGTSLTGLR